MDIEALDRRLGTEIAGLRKIEKELDKAKDDFEKAKAKKERLEKMLKSQKKNIQITEDQLSRSPKGKRMINEHWRTYEILNS